MSCYYFVLLSSVHTCVLYLSLPLLQLLPWWTLRYINLHQQILEACSSQLLSLARSSIDKGLSAPPCGAHVVLIVLFCCVLH